MELGVVIGNTARHVAESDALAHVAGYCVINDLSERAYQLERCGQWVKGKSYDTFAPMGPWLVTLMKCRIQATSRCGWKSMVIATRRVRRRKWSLVWRTW